MIWHSWRKGAAILVSQNKEVGAILNKLSMVKLNIDVTAAILGWQNNEIAAILNNLSIVKLCVDVRAAILLWRNKETAAILNDINMEELCSNVLAVILDWQNKEMAMAWRHSSHIGFWKQSNGDTLYCISIRKHARDVNKKI